MTLVIDREEVATEYVVVGEVTPDPDFLDGLSLTYIGVLASVALAFAFGVSEFETLERIVAGFVVFFGLTLLLKISAARRVILRFSRWRYPERMSIRAERIPLQPGHAAGEQFREQIEGK